MNSEFGFLQVNERPGKPRTTGLTEIRAAYYTPVGPRYLTDVLETMHPYVDSLKFAGGSFVLYPDEALTTVMNTAHDHGVLVSTGGFIERVLTQGRDAVDRYVAACKKVGFDVIELSAGFITLPTDDWLRLVEKVQKAGMRAKPEVGVLFGAGGATPEALASDALQDPEWALARAERFLAAGAYLIQLESEGLTEDVTNWRTDIIARFASRLGIDKLMFEASDPRVFTWYVQNYGPEVNLFVDHSQIVQLEALRRGLWGTQQVWGRVVTYKG